MSEQFEVFEYSIAKTGDQELDDRIDTLISDSNQLYFDIGESGLSDADLVLLKGTHVYKEEDFD